MEPVLSAACPLKRISPDEKSGHYFFGYYDLDAFSKDDRCHLCNRVPFMDRIPSAGDKNEIGLLDTHDGSFTPLAESMAWNFQQGSLLHWNPACAEEIIYNQWQDSKAVCVILNIHTGKERYIDAPIAHVSPDGKWGLSVNFSRIYDFRAGYGYCNRDDPWKDIAQPSDDGIFLLNMHAGEKKLLLSYEKLGEIFNTTAESFDKKIVVNHITFNTASNRFVFLIRYFSDGKGGWKTGIGTSDLEGRVYVLREYTFASHYHWRDEDTLLIFGNCAEGDGLYELQDLTQNFRKRTPEFFPKDIHCSYSPDRRWILGDGYPDGEGYRNLYLYHIASEKGLLLGRFYSDPRSTGDFRCDLHARWNHCGTAISFDSTHEGFRGVYEMDLAALIHNFEGIREK